MKKIKLEKKNGQGFLSNLVGFHHKTNSLYELYAYVCINIFACV